MFVESEIITRSAEKKALPVTALLEENENFYVMVLNSKDEDSYYFEKLLVKTGSKNENWVEIIDGDNLLLDKQVLVKGAFIPLEEG